MERQHSQQSHRAAAARTPSPAASRTASYTLVVRGSASPPTTRPYTGPPPPSQQRRTSVSFAEGDEESDARRGDFDDEDSAALGGTRGPSSSVEVAAHVGHHHHHHRSRSVGSAQRRARGEEREEEHLHSHHHSRGDHHHNHHHNEASGHGSNSRRGSAVSAHISALSPPPLPPHIHVEPPPVIFNTHAAPLHTSSGGGGGGYGGGHNNYNNEVVVARRVFSSPPPRTRVMPSSASSYMAPPSPSAVGAPNNDAFANDVSGNARERARSAVIVRRERSPATRPIGHLVPNNHFNNNNNSINMNTPRYNGSMQRDALHTPTISGSEMPPSAPFAGDGSVLVLRVSAAPTTRPPPLSPARHGGGGARAASADASAAARRTATQPPRQRANSNSFFGSNSNAPLSGYQHEGTSGQDSDLVPLWPPKGTAGSASAFGRGGVGGTPHPFDLLRSRSRVGSTEPENRIAAAGADWRIVSGSDPLSERRATRGTRTVRVPLEDGMHIVSSSAETSSLHIPSASSATPSPSRCITPRPEGGGDEGREGEMRSAAVVPAFVSPSAAFSSRSPSATTAGRARSGSATRVVTVKSPRTRPPPLAQDARVVSPFSSTSYAAGPSAMDLPRTGTQQREGRASSSHIPRTHHVGDRAGASPLQPPQNSRLYPAPHRSHGLSGASTTDSVHFYPIVAEGDGGGEEVRSATPSQHRSIGRVGSSSPSPSRSQVLFVPVSSASPSPSRSSLPSTHQRQQHQNQNASASSVINSRLAVSPESAAAIGPPARRRLNHRTDEAKARDASRARAEAEAAQAALEERMLDDLRQQAAREEEETEDEGRSNHHRLGQQKQQEPQQVAAADPTSFHMYVHQRRQQQQQQQQQQQSPLQVPQTAHPSPNNNDDGRRGGAGGEGNSSGSGSRRSGDRAPASASAAKQIDYAETESSEDGRRVRGDSDPNRRRKAAASHSYSGSSSSSSDSRPSSPSSTPSTSSSSSSSSEPLELASDPSSVRPHPHQRVDSSSLLEHSASVGGILVPPLERRHQHTNKKDHGEEQSAPNKNDSFETSDSDTPEEVEKNDEVTSHQSVAAAVAPRRRARSASAPLPQQRNAAKVVQNDNDDNDSESVGWHTSSSRVEVHAPSRRSPSYAKGPSPRKQQDVRAASHIDVNATPPPTPRGSISGGLLPSHHRRRRPSASVASSSAAGGDADFFVIGDDKKEGNSDAHILSDFIVVAANNTRGNNTYAAKRSTSHWSNSNAGDADGLELPYVGGLSPASAPSYFGGHSGRAAAVLTNDSASFATTYGVAVRRNNNQFSGEADGLISDPNAHMYRGGGGVSPTLEGGARRGNRDVFSAIASQAPPASRTSLPRNRQQTAASAVADQQQQALLLQEAERASSIVSARREERMMALLERQMDLSALVIQQQQQQQKRDGEALYPRRTAEEESVREKSIRRSGSSNARRHLDFKDEGEVPPSEVHGRNSSATRRRNQQLDEQHINATPDASPILPSAVSSAHGSAEKKKRRVAKGIAVKDTKMDGDDETSVVSDGSAASTAEASAAADPHTSAVLDVVLAAAARTEATVLVLAQQVGTLMAAAAAAPPKNVSAEESVGSSNTYNESINKSTGQSSPSRAASSAAAVRPSSVASVAVQSASPKERAFRPTADGGETFGFSSPSLAASPASASVTVPMTPNARRIAQLKQRAAAGIAGADAALSGTTGSRLRLSTVDDAPHPHLASLTSPLLVVGRAYANADASASIKMFDRRKADKAEKEEEDLLPALAGDRYSPERRGGTSRGGTSTQPIQHDGNGRSSLLRQNPKTDESSVDVTRWNISVVDHADANADVSAVSRTRARESSGYVRHTWARSNSLDVDAAPDEAILDSDLIPPFPAKTSSASPNRGGGPSNSNNKKTVHAAAELSRPAVAAAIGSAAEHSIATPGALYRRAELEALSTSPPHALTYGGGGAAFAATASANSSPRHNHAEESSTASPTTPYSANRFVLGHLGSMRSHANGRLLGGGITTAEIAASPTLAGASPHSSSASPARHSSASGSVSLNTPQPSHTVHQDLHARAEQRQDSSDKQRHGGVHTPPRARVSLAHSSDAADAADERRLSALLFSMLKRQQQSQMGNAADSENSASRSDGGSLADRIAAAVVSASSASSPFSSAAAVAEVAAGFAPTAAPTPNAKAAPSPSSPSPREAGLNTEDHPYHKKKKQQQRSAFEAVEVEDSIVASANVTNGRLSHSHDRGRRLFVGGGNRREVVEEEAEGAPSPIPILVERQLSPSPILIAASNSIGGGHHHRDDHHVSNFYESHNNNNGASFDGAPSAFGDGSIPLVVVGSNSSAEAHVHQHQEHSRGRRSHQQHATTAVHNERTEGYGDGKKGFERGEGPANEYASPTNKAHSHQQQQLAPLPRSVKKERSEKSGSFKKAGGVYGANEYASPIGGTRTIAGGAPPPLPPPPPLPASHPLNTSVTEPPAALVSASVSAASPEQRHLLALGASPDRRAQLAGSRQRLKGGKGLVGGGGIASSSPLFLPAANGSDGAHRFAGQKGVAAFDATAVSSHDDEVNKIPLQTSVGGNESESDDSMDAFMNTYNYMDGTFNGTDEDGAVTGALDFGPTSLSDGGPSPIPHVLSAASPVDPAPSSHHTRPSHQSPFFEPAAAAGHRTTAQPTTTNLLTATSQPMAAAAADSKNSQKRTNEKQLNETGGPNEAASDKRTDEVSSFDAGSFFSPRRRDTEESSTSEEGNANEDNDNDTALAAAKANGVGSVKKSIREKEAVEPVDTESLRVQFLRRRTKLALREARAREGTVAAAEARERRELLLSAQSSAAKAELSAMLSEVRRTAADISAGVAASSSINKMAMAPTESEPPTDGTTSTARRLLTDAGDEGTGIITSSSSSPAPAMGPSATSTEAISSASSPLFLSPIPTAAATVTNTVDTNADGSANGKGHSDNNTSSNESVRQLTAAVESLVGLVASQQQRQQQRAMAMEAAGSSASAPTVGHHQMVAAQLLQQLASITHHSPSSRTDAIRTNSDDATTSATESETSDVYSTDTLAAGEAGSNMYRSGGPSSPYFSSTLASSLFSHRRRSPAATGHTRATRKEREEQRRQKEAAEKKKQAEEAEAEEEARRTTAANRRALGNVEALEASERDTLLTRREALEFAELFFAEDMARSSLTAAARAEQQRRQRAAEATAREERRAREKREKEAEERRLKAIAADRFAFQQRETEERSAVTELESARRALVFDQRAAAGRVLAAFLAAASEAKRQAEERQRAEDRHKQFLAAAAEIEAEEHRQRDFVVREETHVFSLVTRGAAEGAAAAAARDRAAEERLAFLAHTEALLTEQRSVNEAVLAVLLADRRADQIHRLIGDEAAARAGPLLAGAEASERAALYADAAIDSKRCEVVRLQRVAALRAVFEAAQRQALLDLNTEELSVRRNEIIPAEIAAREDIGGLAEAHLFLSKAREERREADANRVEALALMAETFARQKGLAADLQDGLEAAERRQAEAHERQMAALSHHISNSVMSAATAVNATAASSHAAAPLLLGPAASPIVATASNQEQHSFGVPHHSFGSPRNHHHQFQQNHYQHNISTDSHAQRPLYSFAQEAASFASPSNRRATTAPLASHNLYADHMSTASGPNAYGCSGLVSDGPSADWHQRPPPQSHANTSVYAASHGYINNQQRRATSFVSAAEVTYDDEDVIEAADSLVVPFEEESSLNHRRSLPRRAQSEDDDKNVASARHANNASALFLSPIYHGQQPKSIGRREGSAHSASGSGVPFVKDAAGSANTSILPPQAAVPSSDSLEGAVADLLSDAEGLRRRTIAESDEPAAFAELYAQAAASMALAHTAERLTLEVGDEAPSRAAIAAEEAAQREQRIEALAPQSALLCEMRAERRLMLLQSHHQQKDQQQVWHSPSAERRGQHDDTYCEASDEDSDECNSDNNNHAAARRGRSTTPTADGTSSVVASVLKESVRPINDGGQQQQQQKQEQEDALQRRDAEVWQHQETMALGRKDAEVAFLTGVIALAAAEERARLVIAAAEEPTAFVETIVYPFRDGLTPIFRRLCEQLNAEERASRREMVVAEEAAERQRIALAIAMHLSSAAVSANASSVASPLASSPLATTSRSQRSLLIRGQGHGLLTPPSHLRNVLPHYQQHSHEGDESRGRALLFAEGYGEHEEADHSFIAECRRALLLCASAETDARRDIVLAEGSRREALEDAHSAATSALLVAEAAEQKQRLLQQQRAAEEEKAAAAEAVRQKEEKEAEERRRRREREEATAELAELLEEQKQRKKKAVAEEEQHQQLLRQQRDNDVERERLTRQRKQREEEEAGQRDEALRKQREAEEAAKTAAEKVAAASRHQQQQQQQQQKLRAAEEEAERLRQRLAQRDSEEAERLERLSVSRRRAAEAEEEDFSAARDRRRAQQQQRFDEEVAAEQQRATAVAAAAAHAAGVERLRAAEQHQKEMAAQHKALQEAFEAEKRRIAAENEAEKQRAVAAEVARLEALQKAREDQLAQQAASRRALEASEANERASAVELAEASAIASILSDFEKTSEAIEAAAKITAERRREAFAESVHLLALQEAAARAELLLDDEPSARRLLRAYAADQRAAIERLVVVSNITAPTAAASDGGVSQGEEDHRISTVGAASGRVEGSGTVNSRADGPRGAQLPVSPPFSPLSSLGGGIGHHQPPRRALHVGAGHGHPSLRGPSTSSAGPLSPLAHGARRTRLPLPAASPTDLQHNSIASGATAAGVATVPSLAIGGPSGAAASPLPAVGELPHRRLFASPQRNETEVVVSGSAIAAYANAPFPTPFVARTNRHDSIATLDQSDVIASPAPHAPHSRGNKNPPQNASVTAAQSATTVRAEPSVSIVNANTPTPLEALLVQHLIDEGHRKDAAIARLVEEAAARRAREQRSSSEDATAAATDGELHCASQTTQDDAVVSSGPPVQYATGSDERRSQRSAHTTQSERADGGAAAVVPPPMGDVSDMDLTLSLNAPTAQRATYPPHQQEATQLTLSANDLPPPPRHHHHHRDDDDDSPVAAPVGSGVSDASALRRALVARMIDSVVAMNTEHFNIAAEAVLAGDEDHASRRARRARSVDAATSCSEGFIDEAAAAAAAINTMEANPLESILVVERGHFVEQHPLATATVGQQSRSVSIGTHDRLWGNYYSFPIEGEGDGEEFEGEGAIAPPSPLLATAHNHSQGSESPSRSRPDPITEARRVIAAADAVTATPSRAASEGVRVLPSLVSPASTAGPIPKPASNIGNPTAAPRDVAASASAAASNRYAFAANEEGKEEEESEDTEGHDDTDEQDGGLTSDAVVPINAVQLRRHVDPHTALRPDATDEATGASADDIAYEGARYVRQEPSYSSSSDDAHHEGRKDDEQAADYYDGNNVGADTSTLRPESIIGEERRLFADDSLHGAGELGAAIGYANAEGFVVGDADEAAGAEEGLSPPSASSVDASSAASSAATPHDDDDEAAGFDGNAENDLQPAPSGDAAVHTLLSTLQAANGSSEFRSRTPSHVAGENAAITSVSADAVRRPSCDTNALLLGTEDPRASATAVGAEEVEELPVIVPAEEEQRRFVDDEVVSDDEGSKSTSDSEEQQPSYSLATAENSSPVTLNGWGASGGGAEEVAAVPAEEEGHRLHNEEDGEAEAEPFVGASFADTEDVDAFAPQTNRTNVSALEGDNLATNGTEEEEEDEELFADDEDTILVQEQTPISAQQQPSVVSHYDYYAVAASADDTDAALLLGPPSHVHFSRRGGSQPHSNGVFLLGERATSTPPRSKRGLSASSVVAGPPTRRFVPIPLPTTAFGLSEAAPDAVDRLPSPNEDDRRPLAPQRGDGGGGQRRVGVVRGRSRSPSLPSQRPDEPHRAAAKAKASVRKVGDGKRSEANQGGVGRELISRETASGTATVAGRSPAIGNRTKLPRSSAANATAASGGSAAPTAATDAPKQSQPPSARAKAIAEMPTRGGPPQPYIPLGSVRTVLPTFAVYKARMMDAASSSSAVATAASLAPPIQIDAGSIRETTSHFAEKRLAVGKNAPKEEGSGVATPASKASKPIAKAKADTGATPPPRRQAAEGSSVSPQPLRQRRALGLAAALPLAGVTTIPNPYTRGVAETHGQSPQRSGSIASSSAAAATALAATSPSALAASSVERQLYASLGGPIVNRRSRGELSHSAAPLVADAAEDNVGGGGDAPNAAPYGATLSVASSAAESHFTVVYRRNSRSEAHK